MRTEEEMKMMRRARNRRYRRRHHDAIMAKQREYRAAHPELREKDRERSRKYHASHKEERSEYFRAWRERNAGRLLAYERKLRASGKLKEKIDRANAVRRERIASDPEYRVLLADAAKRRRARYKATGKSVQQAYRWYLVPKWEKIVAEGRERIARYLRLARPENRRKFMIWYTNRNNLIDRTRGLGRIEQAADEEVGK